MIILLSDNGDVLEYCVNGESKTYDCKANGYAKCSVEKVVSEESEEEEDVAYCAY